MEGVLLCDALHMEWLSRASKAGEQHHDTAPSSREAASRESRV